ncbi:hypothetical protein GOV08_03815 [Candidatus Woesearchaeota archaeon]|nr:hypothetical protein [Candidatus Woesearchaeota archaeon]
MKKIIQPKDWQKILIGIRKKNNYSQTTLAKELKLSRNSVSRFEALQRFPNKESKEKIVNYLILKNYNINELINKGTNYSNEYKTRRIKSELNLKLSEKLAELIGIILGDGEIRSDGTIRISFDPKKDVNYIDRRVIALIQSILGNKVYFESEKRISFGNISFMRYLKSIGLPSGSKFENNIKIPSLFFKNNKYLCAVLRGLFDTDGYFGYLNGSLELMLGRFSEKSVNLVNDISLALKKLNIKHKIITSNDGQFKVRLTDKLEIIRFFSIIGSSNLRNIVRFLLWRINKYEAKIEIEGFHNLLLKAKKIDKNIENISFPFLWNQNNKQFKKYIKEDEIEIKGSKLRDNYSWSKIVKELINKRGQESIANHFKITKRSVRKWREGSRTPSKKYILSLLKMSEENKMKINKYKVIKNG